MKLLLAYPEVECSVTNTHTYSIPLGLGSIGTYCRQRLGDSLDVKILDGSLVGHDEQLTELRKFNPDVLGINTTIGSQRNGYELAKLAKESGALVVFGGVNSTNLWQNMLRNREFIDGVILYEGEIPMFSILNRLNERGQLGNDCFEGIPNLAYKDSNGRVHAPTSIRVHSLDEIPDVDYSLFDLERFFKQTQSRGFGKAISYYAGKGCAKRGAIKLQKVYSPEEYDELIASMDVCTFCGRNELGLREMSEDREARIVRDIHERYGVRGFFNVQDTVNLRNTSAVGLDDSWFRLFIGAEAITEGNIRKLKQRYGPNLIFQAGIEAATPEMRQVYGKKSTNLDDITSKVELMRAEGIQLHASFILGGRGETRSSIQKTTEAARRLASYDNVTWILISPQLILPGSPDYRAFLQLPRMYRKYASQDLVDIPEISRDFLMQFCPELKREEIVEEIKTTFDDIQRTNQRVVLDVKGVVGDEEKYVSPRRPYTNSTPRNT